MLIIKINDKEIRNLDYIEEVNSMEIICHGFVILPRSKAKEIVNFVYEHAKRCSGVISYNKLLMYSDDINEIKF